MFNNYHDVLLKFDNGPYPIMNYCPLLMKNHNFYEVIVIRTVSNLFTMFSTKMSFPTSNSIYRDIPLGVISPCS